MGQRGPDPARPGASSGGADGAICFVITNARACDHNAKRYIRRYISPGADGMRPDPQRGPGTQPTARDRRHAARMARHAAHGAGSGAGQHATRHAAHGARNAGHRARNAGQGRRGKDPGQDGAGRRGAAYGPPGAGRRFTGQSGRAAGAGLTGPGRAHKKAPPDPAGQGGRARRAGSDRLTGPTPSRCQFYAGRGGAFVRFLQQSRKRREVAEAIQKSLILRGR